MPDVWAFPTTEAIREGIDFKAMKVRELIAQQKRLFQFRKKIKMKTYLFFV